VEAVLSENHETVVFGVIGLFTWASVLQEKGGKGKVLFHNTSQSSSCLAHSLMTFQSASVKTEGGRGEVGT
jgi:hypothetical protein